MKVKELVALLVDCNPELEVGITDCSGGKPLFHASTPCLFMGPNDEEIAVVLAVKANLLAASISFQDCCSLETLVAI